MKDFAISDDPAVQRQLDRLADLPLPQSGLGLDKIRAILEALSNPHEALPPVFHVAGTNGKGSTCAFLRAILEADGKRVHITTSPHLVRFNERIRIAGELISDAELASTLEEVLDAAEHLVPSFFEVAIAAAFLAFSRTPADACVIEVGLGGRLDATNVIANPAATGIAALGLDHAEFLLQPEEGAPDDVDERLAFEKSGIRRKGVPLVALSNAPRADRFLEEIAREDGIPLWLQGDAWNVHADRKALHYRDANGSLTLPLPALPGEHQAANAGLAIAMLRAQDRIDVSDKAMAGGLHSANWPARLQKLSPGPLQDLLPGVPIWLDGGHNRNAGDAIAAFVEAQVFAPHCVIGMLIRKDPASLMDPLHGLVESVTIVPVPGQDTHEIAAFKQWPVDVHEAPDVVAALRQIAADKPEAVLITGSLYLAGEVLKLNREWPE
ncbi:bifunctional folylpolyglutamate synthase/dihydrofolate synthase [Aurantiacibacter sediminis]|uniref:Bifunctional folylpolyglutamate synthase/dihydrofolate synthase n=1 Tax=Aurantiacibacter sediminis TaxID=2793064 RepID=A0ABS0N3L8_9SPHN|nr:folylpolyglutamate synthase/dihydrofolate synthase family protein [Aurantiacibacter sediminis]MBH5322317.1 bifunctional folylpolyglutamate synthase/dihydrofolate synthase [Aurantiacibacter sediminis]